MNKLTLVSLSLPVALGWMMACSAGSDDPDKDDDSSQSSSDVGSGGQGGLSVAVGSGGGLSIAVGVGGSCGVTCSADFHAVVDCNGVLIEECFGSEGCDVTSGGCINACEAANNNKQSVGCEYYATDMESYAPSYCFAAFVANTWNTPVHIDVSYSNTPLQVANFTRIPSGQGQSLSYQPYDAAAGLPPGEVAILFLAGSSGGAPNCPINAAVANDAGLSGTGTGNSFRITTDVPVVTYQINPFGGGSVAVTGASLLLPSSAWDTNYIGVNAYQYDLAPPSMNIVASQNNTTVTMVPVAAVNGGGGIPSGPANQPLSFTLQQGQMAQISQNAELSGSVIDADKPIGVMAGQPCMRTPVGVAYCDHGEQMVPPIKALGSEYVGVMYRPRAGEPAIWRLIGAVDGTQLSYSTSVGGPSVINRGQILEFVTGTPFVVTSQDNDHPFLMFTYMSGSQWSQMNNNSGYGDVDFVLSVPPGQYMSQYVFFTDPTYPETNLVLVRAADANGQFSPVNLDCAGEVGGWQPVGDYEWTRVDLSTGDFQSVNGCSNGRHEISSDGRFGLWVWGWGTPLTSSFTSNVSYGYPGGMNVQPINNVIIPPTPN